MVYTIERFKNKSEAIKRVEHLEDRLKAVKSSRDAHIEELNSLLIEKDALIKNMKDQIAFMKDNIKTLLICVLTDKKIDKQLLSTLIKEYPEDLLEICVEKILK